MCLGLVMFRILKQKQYVPVSGECVEVIRYEKDLFPRTKCCYQYNYHGISYEYWETGFYYHIPKMEKGKNCKLFINPNNLTKCITPSFTAVNRDLFIMTVLLVISAFLY